MAGRKPKPTAMKTLGGTDAPKKAEKAAPLAETGEEKIDFSNVKIEPLFEKMVNFETFSKSDFKIRLQGIKKYFRVYAEAEKDRQ